MAYEEYNDDDFNRGHSDKATFSTALISKDGRFLGVNLPPEMQSQLAFVYNTLLDWGRRQVERAVVPATNKLLKSISKNIPDHRAAQIAGRAGDIAGYATLFARQGVEVGSAVYDSFATLHHLNASVRALRSEEGTQAALSSDNEVVSNARAKVTSAFWQRLVKTATSTIGIAPALYSKVVEQGAKNVTRRKQEEYAQIKDDPKKLADFFEKEIEILPVGENPKALALKNVIGRQEADYLAKWEAFKARELSGVRSKLVAELSLTPENVRQKLGQLEDYGVNTSWLKKGLKDAAGNKQETERLLAEFKDHIGSHLEEVAEHKLKSTFVSKEGAFDGEWAAYLPRRSRYSEEPETVREQIEQKYIEYEKNQQKADKEQAASKLNSEFGPNSDLAKVAASLGATVVAEWAGRALGHKYDEHKPIAIDRIMHLKDVMSKEGEHPPQEVPGVRVGDGHERDMSYVQYVHSVFQQHQKDSGRAVVGDRYIDDFINNGWNDQAIQQLSDKDLNPYEYAVKIIAKRIQDGRMDPLALIELAGNKQQKIVRNDGRSFGPLGSGNNDEKVKAAILKAIDEKTFQVHTGKPQTDEELNEKLGNFVFSIDDLKKALTSKNTPPAERAFIFSVFSDVIGGDKRFCDKIGLPAEQCQRLRNESKATFHKLMDSSVLVLAEMLESDSAGLVQRLKMTEQEQQMIQSIAQRIREEGKNAVDVTNGREELAAMETVVTNAAMSLDKTRDKNEPNFWQRVVETSKQPKADIAASESAREREERRRSDEVPGGGVAI